jgi:Spy/CpxP family protein refolding chaperone
MSNHKEVQLKNLAMLLLLTGLMVGCATAANKEVDKKVAGEQSSSAPDAIIQSGHEAIMNSKNLTDEQKQKIVGIMARVRAENLALKEESTKLKIAFFQTLGEKDYKADQVAVIKRRLQKLQNKKMDLMFSSLEEVQGVLGVKSEKDRRDMDQIFRAMGGNTDI